MKSQICVIYNKLSWSVTVVEKKDENTVLHYFFSDNEKSSQKVESASMDDKRDGESVVVAEAVVDYNLLEWTDGVGKLAGTDMKACHSPLLALLSVFSGKKKSMGEGKVSIVQT